MEIFESYLKCLKNNNPLVKAISPPLIMENSKNILIELSIPEEYCQFLTINNGVILGEFELLSLERMKSEKVNMQSVYGEYWKDTILPFAYHQGVGDYLSFTKLDKEIRNRSVILDCFHELTPSEWKIIEESFPIWLDKFIKSNFQLYWLKWEK